MTTAHRPTFDPAKGGTGRNEGDLAKLSQQYSSRDMPSHMTLKYRQKGQAHPDEINTKDLRRDVEEKEQLTSKDRHSRESRTTSGSSSISKRPKLDDPQNLDADFPQDDVLEDSDLDDDSDDEAELMAELERIRKERAAEKAARESKEAEEQEKIRQENILHGNPLLTQNTDFKVKRRWDDDVVFKNCARGIDERKKTPSFINDAIRSEFHRKFMEKYIK
ncbi:unnamed protein product [Meloidogyne enterolobii]|uniref:Uncharacterized protein n=7 Tax=Meloidogyne TaxID=189290 RepID=A0A6V7U345_MELEN|nr:unnamed protein product [Meloidogyne enterolobii]CAD2175989.1 unnamed protein product [Meloidogyne enterolobii]